MRKYLLVLGFWVTGAISVIAAPTVLAEGKPEIEVQPKQVIKDISSLNEIEQPLTTAEGLLVQQPAPTPAPAQVTGVQLKPTEKGLEVLLETAGEFPEVLTSSTENNLITDIPNAQLRLPSGGAFRQDNPTDTVTTVRVENLDAKTIRVTVTGKAGVPTAEVSQSPQALILSVAAPPASQPTPAPTAPPASPAPAPQPTPAPTAPPASPAPAPPPGIQEQRPEPQAEEELLQLEVRAEEEGSQYFAPESSTADRTDTPILDTPASVQVIPQQVLEDQQVTNIFDALRNVSGVSASSLNNTNTFINVRGFQRTPVLVDGFRLGDPEGGDFFETANIESIDVLRGPAALLFGEIEPGGIINIITKRPLSEPFYELELQTGSFGLFRPRIDLSGPLTEDGRLLYRLNAVYSQEDGFRDYDSDYERFAISPVVTWKLGENTDLTFLFDYAKSNQPYDTGTSAFEDGVLDIPRDRILNEPEDRTNSEFVNVGYDLKHRFSENWRLQNGFRFTHQRFDLLGNNPIFLDDATGIADRSPAFRETEFDSYSLQTNLVGEFATGPINHTLLAGVDLNRELSNSITRFDFINTSPLDVFDPDYSFTTPDIDDIPVAFGNDTVVGRLGAYLQDQLEWGRFTLVGGVRYDLYHNSSIILDESLDETQEDQTETAFTPRLALIYKPTDNSTLYGSYSRSFIPSSDVDIEGSFLEPERGEGFEVGIKTEWLGDRLFASLAYFDITRQNVATEDLDFPDAFVSIASGKQRSQGVELDVRGEILPGWNLLASYSYIDTGITEDNTLPIGNELAGVPRNSFSFWTTYQLQSGNLQGLGFGLGVNYVGERAGDLLNTYEVGSYFLTNAAIFYRRENWDIALNFNNIFDQNYILGASSSTSRQGGLVVGDPFTVVGSVTVRF